MNQQQLGIPIEADIDERRGCTSASNAEADSLCHGRHMAQKGKVSPDSKDAAHGRVIHHALATGDTSQLTLEQREIYDSCIDIENRIMANLFPELANTKQTYKSWREQRFWCKVPPNGHEHSAKPDVVNRLGPRAMIAEYKTLAGDVPESPRNLQLRDQAVLVQGNLLVNQIAVVVIQPLVTHTPEICFYEVEDLQRAKQEMFARVNTSYDPKSPRVAGEIQCKHCLARKDCEAYQKWAGAMVPNMLSLLDVPITAWTPEQKSQFLERAPVAQKWLDDCIAEMKRILKGDSNAIPGFTLKEGARRENITDPQGVFDRFSTLGGTPEQFLKCVTVKKTELKQQVNAVTGDKGKALDKRLHEMLEGLVEIKQNEPSIVKEDWKK